MYTETKALEAETTHAIIVDDMAFKTVRIMKSCYLYTSNDPQTRGNHPCTRNWPAASRRTSPICANGAGWEYPIDPSMLINGRMGLTLAGTHFEAATY